MSRVLPKDADYWKQKYLEAERKLKIKDRRIRELELMLSRGGVELEGAAGPSQGAAPEEGIRLTSPRVRDLLKGLQRFASADHDWGVRLYKKGADAIKLAIQMDTECKFGDIEVLTKILEAYKEGARNLKDGRKYDQNKTRVDQVTAKCIQVIDRAETIKKLIKELSGTGVGRGLSMLDDGPYSLPSVPSKGVGRGSSS